MSVFSPSVLVRAVLVASLLGGAFAMGEIEKRATLGSSGIRAVWWPKIKAPKGWRHDETLSVQNAINLLLPKGRTFANAPSVIYARAFYQPAPKKRGTLQAFIDDDLERSREHAGALTVKELTPMKDARGRWLRAFSLASAGASYERILYGSEGDFWTMFVISSKSEAALRKDLGTFARIVGSYR